MKRVYLSCSSPEGLQEESWSWGSGLQPFTLHFRDKHCPGGGSACLPTFFHSVFLQSLSLQMLADLLALLLSFGVHCMFTCREWAQVACLRCELTEWYGQLLCTQVFAQWYPSLGDIDPGSSTHLPVHPASRACVL